MKRHLLNKKGSSLIMVLGAMLILTAVGVLVITMSSANIRMSSKYNTWTAEYYDLDAAAQERLSRFDSETLRPAEEMARYYLQNSYFSYEKVENFPGGVANEPAGKLKALLSKYPAIQTLLYNEAKAAADTLSSNESGTNPNIDPQAEYDKAMKKLATEAFDILYYCAVNDSIQENDDAAIEEPQPYSKQASVLTVWEPADENWFPVSILNIASALNAISANSPRINLTAYEAEAVPPETEDIPKQVVVAVTLKSPGYELLPQKRYVPLKVNPLYTNAISAGGMITFDASAQITGDVVSGNITPLDGDGIPEGEGELSGIYSRGGADVSIRGNVYSMGDIHVFGTGGKIVVSEYGSYTNSLKQRLYNNDYFLYEGFVTSNSPYTEGHTESGVVPYIYEENKGGNAYCNSLAAEPGASGAVLTVAGDLWTRDDIQNDATGAKITVGGNYIGISSSASGGDPNASSAVINNAVHLNGEITIGGDYIIPGTAFYVFAGGKGSHNNIVAYYQTAESGSARTLESFTAYMATGSESSNTYFANKTDDESYVLYETSDLAQKILHLKNYYITNGITPESGISVKNNANYYSLGVVVDSDGTIRYNTDDATYAKNEPAYALMRAALFDMLVAKARHYGTGGADQRSFDGLINTTFGVSDTGKKFYYYSGVNASVSLGNGSGGISEGIIYCDTDLNITAVGDGTFHGAIICRGNVTVSGNVKIIHDESAILKVLGVSYGSNIIPANSGSRIARRFFSPQTPLTMGNDLGTEQIDTVSANVGERTMSDAVDRYTINAWRESRVAP